MIEVKYRLSSENKKTIEKIIMDENIHYMHMILPKGERLPEHYTNAKSVYMTVVRGTLTISLDNQATCEYDAGTVLKIPFNSKMNVQNFHKETLELIVIKAPAPNK